MMNENLFFSDELSDLYRAYDALSEPIESIVGADIEYHMELMRAALFLVGEHGMKLALQATTYFPRMIDLYREQYEEYAAEVYGRLMRGTHSGLTSNLDAMSGIMETLSTYTHNMGKVQAVSAIPVKAGVA